MDSNELERERGHHHPAPRTPPSTTTDHLINIVDTPGHADFGGEVERTLSMVDGVMLLVDASEGPLPQTRFVLRKALERGLPPIVVINKIDRSDARVQDVAQRGLRPVHRPRRDRRPARLPGALHQRARRHGDDRPGDAGRGPAAAVRRGDRATCRRAARIADAPLQALVANLDSERLSSAASPSGASSTAASRSATRLPSASSTARFEQTTVTKLYMFDGLKRVDVNEASAGDIICLAGIENIMIGETIADAENPVPFQPIAVDEPTVSMIFGVNTSPFAGRDGKYVTSRQIEDRLDRELLGNVSIRVEPTETPEQMKVLGRGELQLSILIEMMRREGYELQVSRPGDRASRRSTA